MKRVIKTKARVEHADCPKNCLFLECLAPSGRLFETAVSFDGTAPKHSMAFQRYRLVEHLIACQGLDAHDAWATNLRLLTGRFYVFRLIELAPSTWAIDAAKAGEPFEIPEPDHAEIERLLRETRHVC
jgi:hypothetical protein